MLLSPGLRPCRGGPGSGAQGAQPPGPAPELTPSPGPESPRRRGLQGEPGCLVSPRPALADPCPGGLGGRGLQVSFAQLEHIAVVTLWLQACPSPASLVLPSGSCRTWASGGGLVAGSEWPVLVVQGLLGPMGAEECIWGSRARAIVNRRRCYCCPPRRRGGWSGQMGLRPCSAAALVPCGCCGICAQVVASQDTHGHLGFLR